MTLGVQLRTDSWNGTPGALTVYGLAIDTRGLPIMRRPRRLEINLRDQSLF